jgi:lipopolysaccharide transport system ATP-binding protein
LSDVVISAEGLGKSYRLRHDPRGGYVALRDVVAEKFRSLARRMTGRRIASEADEEEFWALREVSFDVRRGEVVGIIGRNGAGKSTLLKILSRITEPTEGRVRVRGRVASLLEVGTGFHPELTGRENIFLNGAILGMARADIRRKFEEIVSFAEVEQFLDTPVKRYSSGMYVRLAFAVAAHLEPEILVVDEVLAVGDAEFQKKCLGKMRDVSRGGRTVLFVSHNMATVQTLCGTGALLDRGRLRRVGPVDLVISEYLAGLRRAGGGSGGALIDLGPALSLAWLGAVPEMIESGEPASLRFRLIPRAATVLRELALLVYSEYGVRVAVLDLRRQGVRDLSLGQAALDFEVRVESFPLVEGDYRIGFYVVTSDYRDNYLDVASISVVSALRIGDFVPYAAEHRGFVTLDFSVSHGPARSPECVP